MRGAGRLWPVFATDEKTKPLKKIQGPQNQVYGVVTF